MNRTLTSALVVTAVAGVLVGGAAFVGPPDAVVREHSERVEPVIRSVSVCPYVGGEPRATSRIGVLALPGVAEPEPPAEPADDEGAAITVRALRGAPAEEDDDAESEEAAEDPEPVVTVTERGVPALATIEAGQTAGYSVLAEGPLAPGIVAEQWMLAEGPDLRGIVGTACTGPAREHWFVGGSGEVGRRGRLVLSNQSSTAAIVNVTLWNETGPVDAPGTKDVTIAPGAQQVLLLDALAPESAHVAVRVTATQGRVAAAIDHRESDEGEPRGISMIPAAVAPAEEIVVPGVPGHGSRSLRILAPGDIDAIVSLQVLGPDGAFSPVDHDVLTVPAGTVFELPITDALGDGAAAIRLESDEPITAAVRVVDESSDGLPELAFTAASAALPAGPVAVVFGGDGDALSTRLYVTAVGDTGGRVIVRTLDADGAASEEQTVEIPAGTTTVIELGVEEGSWLAAIVEVAAAGTIVAAREVVGTDDGGSLLDLMPLVPAQLTVAVPEVASELPTGLRPAGGAEQ